MSESCAVGCGTCLTCGVTDSRDAVVSQLRDLVANNYFGEAPFHKGLVAAFESKSIISHIDLLAQFNQGFQRKAITSFGDV